MNNLLVIIWNSEDIIISTKSKDKLFCIKSYCIAEYGNDIFKIVYAYIQKYSKKIKNVKLILNNDIIKKRFENCPKMSYKHLDLYIKNNLTEFLPLSSDEYIFDYKILTKDENIRVMIVAVDIKYIRIFLDFFDEHKLICSKIDIYPNVISKMILSIYKLDTFIIYKLKEKFCFIYLKDKSIQNIRYLILNDSLNIYNELCKAFLFYNNEFKNFEKVFIFDEIFILEDFFKNINVEIVNKNLFKQMFNVDFDQYLMENIYKL